MCVTGVFHHQIRVKVLSRRTQSAGSRVAQAASLGVSRMSFVANAATIYVYASQRKQVLDYNFPCSNSMYST